jgi:hypothetical protein
MFVSRRRSLNFTAKPYLAGLTEAGVKEIVKLFLRFVGPK